MVHIVSAKCVKADPKKTAAMLDCPAPSSVKALRGFLGLTGYNRKFIQNYGHIAAPLTNLLKKDAFHWSNQADLGFQKLKSIVATPPVLALPDFTKTFLIECDASGIGIGAVLMQDWRPISLHNQVLKGRSLYLPTNEKELLALVTAVRNL